MTPTERAYGPGVIFSRTKEILAKRRKAQKKKAPKKQKAEKKKEQPQWALTELAQLV